MAVPEAMPTRVTGTEPVSEFDEACPRGPLDLDEHVRNGDLPVRVSSFQYEQHPEERERQE